MDHDEILLRIDALERQLLDLRRELDEPAEPLPQHPFSVLELRLGETWYGLPIDALRQVLSMVWPHPLPESPDWVLGTFRHGETLVPIIDLGQRLGGDRLDLDPSWILLLGQTEPPVAFVVHEVRRLLELDPKTISPPARGIPQAPFLLGSVGDDSTGILHLLSPGRLGRDLAPQILDT